MVARLGVIAGIVCGQYVPEIGPTTLLATITATIIILICALWLPLIRLAERTSFVIIAHVAIDLPSVVTGNIAQSEKYPTGS